MSMVDKLLGPLVEHTIDDGEGGQWVVALRPRCSGPRITRNTVIRFRRPERRNGFGVRLHVLHGIAALTSVGWQDLVAEFSIPLTRTMALNALAWIDTLNKEKD